MMPKPDDWQEEGRSAAEEYHGNLKYVMRGGEVLSLLIDQLYANNTHDDLHQLRSLLCYAALRDGRSLLGCLRVTK